MLKSVLCCDAYDLWWERFIILYDFVIEYGLEKHVVGLMNSSEFVGKRVREPCVFI